MYVSTFRRIRLVGWLVLRHINLCILFNSKSISILITLVNKEIEASTKIPVLTLFEGAEFKFEICFYSSHLVFFLDMHSVHFVHIRYIKAYMNSGLIIIL